MKLFIFTQKMLFLTMAAAILFASCFLFEEPEPEDPIYKDFYNYPVGREDDNGTLRIINSVASPVLLFKDSVSPGNYIGTVGSSSQINVKLVDENFYTIVAVDRATYAEKGDKAFQFSAITYYSHQQNYSITVSVSNAFGAGKWIINNHTSYWVSFKKSDQSGTIFAVAAPNAKRVTVPVEFNKAYDFIPHFYKELRQNGKVIAMVESDDQSQGDTVYTTEGNQSFYTDIRDIDIKPDDSENIKPAVLVKNSSDKTVRVYAGNKQLITGTGVEDFALTAGRSQLFTGLEQGDNVNGISFEATAWSGRVYVSEDMIMQNNKVYLIELSGKDGVYSTKVTEEDAEDYFGE